MNTATTTRNHSTSDRLAQVAAFFLLTLTLVVSIGFQPAHATQLRSATPFVDALNDPVEAGAVVDLFGDGFQPGELVVVEFGGWTISTTVADQYGSIFTSGVVDTLMPPGTHPLDAVGDFGSWATTDLTVVDPPAPPPVQLYPYVGTLQMSVDPGGVVDVIGGDFQPYETVTVEFGGLVLDVVSADANGEFYAVGWIDPLMPDGFHPLDAWGDLGSFATGDLEVWSAPVTNPVIYSWGPAPQNSSAIIEGDGFAPFENVWIDFGGLSTPVTADDWGYFTADVFVPADMPVGAHPVDAWGDTGTYATTDQYVDPAVVSKPVTPPPAPKAPTPKAQPKTEESKAQVPPSEVSTKSESKPEKTIEDEETEQAGTVDQTSKRSVQDEDATETADDDNGVVESDDSDASEESSSGAAGTEEQDTPSERVTVNDDSGVSLLGAGVAGIALAGATAGAAAMVGRRRR